MRIDKQKDYKVLSYTYRNFVTLSNEENLMILKERNHPDVKKWMFTNNDIGEKEHLDFIASLSNRSDAFYWLIEREETPIGVLNLVHFNEEKGEGEAGYYLFSEYLNSGIGLEMQYAYKKFFFEVLSLENLPGHIQYGNTSAYLLTTFFGGVEDGETIIDGKRYLKMHTPKQNFEAIKGEKLTVSFVKYIKTHQKKWE